MALSCAVSSGIAGVVASFERASSDWACPSWSGAGCTSVGSIRLDIFLFRGCERLFQGLVQGPVFLQSNVAESVALGQFQGLAAHQLEHCQEETDHSAAAFLAFEKLR